MWCAGCGEICRYEEEETAARALTTRAADALQKLSPRQLLPTDLHTILNHLLEFQLRQDLKQAGADEHPRDSGALVPLDVCLLLRSKRRIEHVDLNGAVGWEKGPEVLSEVVKKCDVVDEDQYVADVGAATIQSNSENKVLFWPSSSTAARYLIRH